MLRSLPIFLLLVGLVSPTFAQVTVPSDPSFSVPSGVTVAQGDTLVIPVSISDPSGFVSFFGLEATCDVNQLQFTGAGPGTGLDQHIADNGLPPNCDIIIYPSQLTISMVMLWAPYDIALYGSDFFYLELATNATAPGTTILTVTNPAGTQPSVDVTVTITAAAAADQFMRGDANADNSCNISDAVTLLSYMFAAGAAPSCLDAGDVNDDGSITIADPVSLLGALFGGGNPPVEVCAVDLTPDSLDCVSSTCP
ncbi:MAG: dockerin type I repeat-containing protein [Planctomycetota bacterium]